MGKNSPNITLYFLSFIPAHPKGFEHNFLKSVKIFLLHLADFESGSICQRRDMNLYDLNNASLCHHAPVQGWDVAHKVWLSQPSVTAANTEILAWRKGCGSQQTRTGLKNTFVGRVLLTLPALQGRVLGLSMRLC